MTSDESKEDKESKNESAGTESNQRGPHPRAEPEGNYRPIDGPIPGADDSGCEPTLSDLSGGEQIQRRFVDEVREIDVPGGDPVSVGMLTDLALEDDVITATVDCSVVDSTVAYRVGNQLNGIGLSLEGVEHVRLQSVPSRRGDSRVDPEGVDAVVAVAGAKGGTGKSTLTLALARRLAERGLDVGVFDADLQAPDLTELVGLSDPLAPTPLGGLEPATVDGIQLVSIDLITGDRPVAWRGAMTHDVLEDVLEDAAWQDRDVLLVDMPPGLGEVPKRVFQRVAVDGAVLVTTPADVSLRNVERTAGLLAATDVPVTAVVENMVGPDAIRPGDRSVETLVKNALGTPRHIQVPFDPGLQGTLLEETTQLSPACETALSAVAETTRELLETVTATVPDDAVNLTGLPDGLQEKQAVLEVDVTDSSTALVVDSDEVPALVDREADGPSTVSAVDSHRRLVRIGGDHA